LAASRWEHSFASGCDISTIIDGQAKSLQNMRCTVQQADLSYTAGVGSTPVV
jgi:hypothetical protein